jgi:hypothetical protein
MNKLEQLLALNAKLKAETVTTYEVHKPSVCGKAAIWKSSKGKEVEWTTDWLQQRLEDGSAKADKNGIVTFTMTKKVYEY